MKHARKMKLVDINYTPDPVKENVQDISIPNVCNSLENKKNDAISFLDRHMKAILESTNLSDFDKWTQYNQALTRYLHWFKEKNNDETVNLHLKKLIEAFNNDSPPTNDAGHRIAIGSDSDDSDDSVDYVNVNKKRKRNVIETPRKRVKSEIQRKQKTLKNQKSKLLFKKWISKLPE